MVIEQPVTGGHIRLTSHRAGLGAPALTWGAPTAAERGPVVGTTTSRAHRNVIGPHSGSAARVHRPPASGTPAIGSLVRSER
jgi:hypothetical protein